MFFGRRQRASKEAADAIARQKAMEEARRREEEAAARTDEAKKLNAEVQKRLRRYSGEREDGESPSITPERVTRKSRIVRSGSMSDQEVRAINRVVSEKELEWRARAAAFGELHSSSRAGLVTLAPTDRGSNADDEAEDEEEAPAAEPVRKSSLRKGGKSARERMAEMQRESEEKKAVALGRHADAPPAGAESSLSAKKVGTARASAKVAGGIFLTYDQHAVLLEKMKVLQNQNEELTTANEQLTDRLASLERLADEYVAKEGSFMIKRDKEGSVHGEGSVHRGKSPGLRRSKSPANLIRVITSALARNATFLGVDPGPFDTSVNGSPVLVVRPPKPAAFAA